MEREWAKIAEALAKEGEFAAKPAAEQAEILKQIREAIEIEAHAKLSAKLDQKIADGERWAKEAAAEQDRFTEDTVRDSLEYAEAAQRAKESLPPPSPGVETPGARMPGAKAPGQRTPDPHGKPTGRRAQVSSKDKDPANIRAIARENESADVLARHGHVVEQAPKVPGGKNPDYLIDGEIFDNYAPTTTKVRSIWSEIQNKVTSRQTNRIVLNLSDNRIDLVALKAQFDQWPIPGLKQIIAIDGETVIHFWP